jgi:hypothetical protein
VKALLAVSNGIFFPPLAVVVSNVILATEQPQSRSTRKRHIDRLTESLAAEKPDDDGQPLAPQVPCAHATNTGAVCTKFVPESVSEEEDEDFDLPDLEEVSHSSDDESDDESETEQLDNAEVSLISLLP